MNFFLLLLLRTTLAIDQACQQAIQCPANSYCLFHSSMCACDSGYIGQCNIPALPLNSQPITANFTFPQALLFQIDPMQLNVLLQFLFTICISGQQQISVTLTLWGETGSNTAYVPDNALGSPTSAILDPGCQQFIAPYTSFGTQPNGQDEMLVLGITLSSSDAPISMTISVSQEVIAGIFVYYYILIGMIVVVIVVIVIGVAVFIVRRRRRLRSQNSSPAIPQPAFNNIEYFQDLMPVFVAEQIGSQRQICSICLQNIEKTELLRKTPCRHIFHSICIDSWCLKNLTCPVCRTELTLENLQQTTRNFSTNQSTCVEQHIEQEIKRQQLEAQPKMHQKQQIEQIVQFEAPRPINFDQLKYDIRQHML